MGSKTPTGAWTRTPRLTAEDLSRRAYIRHERAKRFFVGTDGKTSWIVETHAPPHRNRPTPARKHLPRNTPTGTVTRLSAVF